MDKGVFFALVDFAALVIVAALMVTLLSPFLASLAWAGVIALAAYPVHKAIFRKTRNRPNLAAFLTTALIVLIAVVPLVFLAVLLANETIQVVAFVQGAAAEGKIPGREQVLANPNVAKFLERFAPYLTKVDLKPVLLSSMKVASSVAIGASKAVFVNIFGFIVKFFIMVIVLFFTLRDGESMASQFWSVIPLKERDKEIILDTLRRVVSAVLYGIVLTCLLQGILGGVGFALVGLPSAVFFGALMTLCAFIPVVGTALVWVPGALYLFGTGQYGKGLFLVLWCVLVVSSIDNIFRPLFISGRAKIPILVIALGVLGGLITFGFLGVILGPLLFAVSLEVFRIYREQIFPSRRIEEEVAARAEAASSSP